MGCEVQKLDTGQEIDVHHFDTFEDAKQYVEVSRRYAFDRLDAWGIDGNIYMYVGPNPGERAAIRRATSSMNGRTNDLWRASFWIDAPKQNKATALDAILHLLPQLAKSELVLLVEEAAALNNRQAKFRDTVLNIERRTYIGELGK